MDKAHHELPPLVLDDAEAGRFLVNRISMTSEEIWQIERASIFDRCWLYVGHESEVAEPNQYRSRTIAGRPVILCRDEEGGVNVFLNSCTHRGTTLCREKSTSGRFLRCFFHAWTFDSSGALVSLPDEGSYGPNFERANYALVRPPLTGNYRGFVFVNFDHEAEPLEDYLDGAREYLDLLLEHGAGRGLLFSRREQEYSIRANWKLLMENSVDGYHGLPTHKRWFDMLKAEGVDIRRRLGSVRSHVETLGHGHAITFAPPLAADPPGGAIAAAEAERRRGNVERLGPSAASQLDTARALLIFPNLIVIDLPPGITVRRVEPQAPDRLDVQAWFVVPQEEPEALQRWRLEFASAFWGPGGLGTPDDIEALECCQRGFGGVKEQPWSDISRGMHKERPTGTDELQMRTFWRRWHEMLTGQATELVQR